ncbi:uncharacterized protein LOC135389073 [Ornithodoros turicata]|uniref:uncharacterized protein LOC135389073 n=1 Tax=Ornithodoros turicata TaxID=34597 RepID=UPI00313906F1
MVQDQPPCPAEQLPTAEPNQPLNPVPSKKVIVDSPVTDGDRRLEERASSPTLVCALIVLALSCFGIALTFALSRGAPEHISNTVSEVLGKTKAPCETVTASLAELEPASTHLIPLVVNLTENKTSNGALSRNRWKAAAQLLLNDSLNSLSST